MAPRPQPAADRFVVQAEEGREDEVRRALEAVGQVESGPATGSFVVRLRESAEAQATWHSLLQRVPGTRWVAPVLRDAAGAEQWPAGGLMVRFARRLADDELARFGGEAGLVFEKRSEFAPEQALFRPRDPRATYLPGLVDALGACAEVQAAWAVTWSRYRRS